MSMSTTAVSTKTRSRVTSTPPPAATSSLPPPLHLTAAQVRELESELHRELAALERRLVGELQAESNGTHVVALHDGATTTGRSSDTVVRRDVVSAALERLASGEYGLCTRCGEPIPYGRLLVMPEATHCLGCSARS
jgi:RNA polymerase-binding transcription factor DksA